MCLETRRAGGDPALEAPAINRWWRSESLREDEGERRRSAHTSQNKEFWTCILHYLFETQIFKEPRTFIKGSTPMCINLRPHSGPAVPRMGIMWWKLPKSFHEILLILYVGRSCKRTTFDPNLCVDNRSLRQASPHHSYCPTILRGPTMAVSVHNLDHPRFRVYGVIIVWPPTRGTYARYRYLYMICRLWMISRRCLLF